jgi:membrane protein DedA with SNARE-associated domain
MEALLVKYGYLVLALGVSVEGEVFLLAASFMAHRGLIFSLPVVMLVAGAANCGADQPYYMLARTRGRAWLQRRFGGHPRYQKVLDLMKRHGNWLLLGSRYAFGFRIIIPAACGAFGMPPLRFTIINYLGSLQIAGWLARFCLLALFLRPVILRSRAEAPATEIESIFKQHGRHSLSASPCRATSATFWSLGGAAWPHTTPAALEWIRNPK